jgi:hypothetical protein
MSSKLPKRLNARLDEETAKKIEFLQKSTKHNTTDVIRMALELYYKAVVNEQMQARQNLLESPFIGCIQDDEELSKNYKTILTKSLKAKS